MRLKLLRDLAEAARTPSMRWELCTAAQDAAAGRFARASYTAMGERSEVEHTATAAAPRRFPAKFIRSNRRAVHGTEGWTRDAEVWRLDGDHRG